MTYGPPPGNPPGQPAGGYGPPQGGQPGGYDPSQGGQPGGYNPPPASYGQQPPGQYGAPQGQFGPPQQYGAPQGQYGPPQQYGAPQGHSAGPARPGFDVSKVNPLDWAILAAGVLVFIFSFIDFYDGADVSFRGQTQTVSTVGSASAWHDIFGGGFFAWFAMLFAVLGAVAVALELFVPTFKMAVANRLAGLGLFALAAIFEIIAIFVTPSESAFGATASANHGFGFWISLVLILAGLVLSLMRMQQTGAAMPGFLGSLPSIGGGTGARPSGQHSGYGAPQGYEPPQQPGYGQPQSGYQQPGGYPQQQYTPTPPPSAPQPPPGGYQPPAAPPGGYQPPQPPGGYPPTQQQPAAPQQPGGYPPPPPGGYPPPSGEPGPQPHAPYQPPAGPNQPEPGPPQH